MKKKKYAHDNFTEWRDISIEAGEPKTPRECGDAQRATETRFKRLIDRKKCWIKGAWGQKVSIDDAKCVHAIFSFIFSFIVIMISAPLVSFFPCTHALLFSTSFFTSQQCVPMCYDWPTQFCWLLHLFCVICSFHLIATQSVSVEAFIYSRCRTHSVPSVQ